LTDEEIVGNVKAFFIAGSESTAVIISWCAYHLCVSPDLQAAVQAEVDAVLGGDDAGAGVGAAAMAAASAGRLPLCAACFQEALRLNGPVSFLMFGPAGQSPVTLSNGLVVRPGDNVDFYFDGCMLDPHVYPEPHTYMPSRWLVPDNVSPAVAEAKAAHIKRMHADMLAFGYGPRVCLGMALATAEGVACLAALARTYSMRLACPAEHIKREFNFSTQASSMPVIFTRRHHGENSLLSC